MGEGVVCFRVVRPDLSITRLLPRNAHCNNSELLYIYSDDWVSPERLKLKLELDMFRAAPSCV